MVTVSLVLHGGVAAGIGFAHFHGTAASVVASSEVQPLTLTLLRSVETPDYRPAALAKSAATNPAAVRAPAVLPAPSQPVVEKEIPAAAPPPALALEADPNAHVRALPPEEVLSPHPAPHLNGKNGVVFVLDVSGSMYEPYAGSTRLAFARQTLSRSIRALKDGTPFAVTVYGETARNSGPLVSANDATREAAVRFIMQEIDCGGGTNLPAGLASAGELETGRMVLVSDGDLNISGIDLMTQARDILGPVGECPGLTVIGIGPRPNSEARQLLKGLADQQGGTYCSEQFDDPELLTANRPASATP